MSDPSTMTCAYQTVFPEPSTTIQASLAGSMPSWLHIPGGSPR
ncbi:MAG TPA: hypothetical protein VIX62_06495 [Actinomycetota bacterium]